MIPLCVRTFPSLALLLCLLPIATGQEPAAETTGELRVLSYNIHHGEGIDGKLDLERIARVIESEKPDLVALQEVDRNVKRSNNVDQPAELAKLTKMNVVFGGNIALQGGDYGNAILSRYPIVAHKNHGLPLHGNGEQRGVLEANIKLPGQTEPLLFLATHFDHRRDDTERIDSAKAVNVLLSKRPDSPALLAGDLNDVLGSKTLTELQTAWTAANQKPLPTIPVQEPKRQIDFVLSRPAATWKVNEVKVLDEAVASDHRPILAVFERKAAP